MNLKGLIPAPFTPFHPDGTIHPEVIPAYANRLQKKGVIGVFINGTTGEGLLLTMDERKKMAEAWIDHQCADFRVIIHVGATSIEDSLELTRHAASIGAHAVSTMAPLFLKPQNVKALVDYCAIIADEAADMPFYFYHIPQITGQDFMMVEFLEYAEGKIPNLAGIKYSGTNIMDVLLCAEYENQRMDIIYGQDEKLLAGLVFGLEGAIGSTYNYMPGHYIELIQAYRDGDLEKARKYQLASAQLVRYMDQYGGGIRVGKRIMKEIGIDCGDLRSPGQSITELEWKDFQNTLVQNDLHLFEEVSQFAAPKNLAK